MQAARHLTREKGVRMYVAVNIYSRDSETRAIADYLGSLATVEPDALIVADPAIFMHGPQAPSPNPLHMSTQANTTNTGTARFWRDLGATRVNTARELTLEEIRQLAAESGIEVEAFVHGAMCMAYSGRCLLSGYMNNRGSNRGMCSQPCRFHYTVMEQLRPGQYFPIAEDPRGAYLFNSRDLCMVAHLPEMIDRRHLQPEDRRPHEEHPLPGRGGQGLPGGHRRLVPRSDGWQVQPHWLKELAAISHRGYCTGFYFGDPAQTAANLDNLVQPRVSIRGKVVGQKVPAWRRPGAGEKQDRYAAMRWTCSPRQARRARTASSASWMNKVCPPLAQPGSTVTVPPADGHRRRWT
jgi:putative protease